MGIRIYTDAFTNNQAATLSDMLNAIDRRDLSWHLLDLWAIVEPKSGINILDLKNRAISQPLGVELTWSRLHGLSDHLDQRIECELAAWRPGDKNALRSPP